MTLALRSALVHIWDKEEQIAVPVFWCHPTIKR